MRVFSKISQQLLWRGLYLFSLFIINLLIARILGAEVSGNLNLLINNLSFWVLILGLSLETGIVYYSASKEIARSKLFTLILGWSVLVLLATWAMSGILSWESSIPLQVFLIPLYSLSLVVISQVSGIYQGMHNFKVHNAALVAVNFILIAYLLFLLAYNIGDEHAPVRVMTAYLLSIVVQALVLLILATRAVQWRHLEVPSLVELKKIFRYSLLAWAANLIFFLVYRVDYWIIKYYRSDYELGNYIQVSKLVQVFILIPGLVAAVIFPETAKDRSLRMRNHVMKASRIFAGVYFVFLILLTLVGKALFPLLYGETFNLMYLSFVLLIPGILFLSVQNLLAAWFAGSNQTRYNLFGALIAIAVITILDFLLIPRYGIHGAALTSSVGYFVYFFYQYKVFAGKEFLKATDLLLIKKEDISWLRSLFTKTSGA
jgi:O-antigen/teichoic acid export membrane protein